MKNFVRVLTIFLALTFSVTAFADKDHDDDHDDNKKHSHKEKKSEKNYSKDGLENYSNGYKKTSQNNQNEMNPALTSPVEQNEENTSLISSKDRQLAIRKFFGTVKKMTKGDPSIWTIDGQTIVITRNTFISEKYGKVKIGTQISGEGKYIGNNLVALRIEAQSNGQNPVNPAGRIDKIPAGGLGTWIIDGKEVYVSESTIVKQLNGKAEIGAFVNIKGSYVKDVYKAKEIEVRK